MTRRRRHPKRKHIAAPPGTLMHVGERRSEQVRIRIIDYDASHFASHVVEKSADCFAFRDKSTVTWINVDGLHDVELIETLGRHFSIHPLVLEDILHTDQRPKFEDYDDQVFVVVRMLNMGDGLEDEQLSIILGHNYLLSFQEREGDVFEAVRERLRSGRVRIRSQGSDYLAYALLDAIMDQNMHVSGLISEQIDDLGNRLMTMDTREDVESIFDYRLQVMRLWKCTAPLVDVVGNLQKSESQLISDETTHFLRDLHDHAVRTRDFIDHLRSMTTGLFDLYLAQQNQRLNEVMKVLTIVATVFIPLTFVAGIYGMNFENMPELGWRWGYPAVLVLMVCIVFGMLIYIRRRNWW